MPQDAEGRYYEADETRSGMQLASAARTTTVNGTAFSTADVDDINGALDVTVVTGTNPTLDVILQTTADGTNYYTVGSFTQATDVTAESKIFTGLGPLSRWKWTIGGTATPTFTFSITSTFERD